MAAMRSRHTSKQDESNAAGEGWQLSVVVPAYNEVDNVRPLCERLFANVRETAPNMDVELLIMDDESTGTPKTEIIVQDLQNEGYAIRIHVRRKGEGRGLSSAVLLGFKMAKYPVLLCMDADLQHEPESVVAVATPVLRGEAEFSVGSRYTEGGTIVGERFHIGRKIISVGATLLAAPLVGTADPMSGFFCTSAKVLERGIARCNPIGWKVGLEVGVRCRCNPVADVPITFCDRVAGESKLTMKENILYLQQLGNLYWDMYSLLLLSLIFIMVLAISYLARCLL